MIFLKCLSLCGDNGFAVIFNVSRSELIFCGIAGLVAEGVFVYT